MCVCVRVRAKQKQRCKEDSDLRGLEHHSLIFFFLNEINKFQKDFLADSDKRGRGRGIMGERRGRVKSRNKYKGPMDKDSKGKG